jgi:hypothetical protein
LRRCGRGGGRAAEAMFQCLYVALERLEFHLSGFSLAAPPLLYDECIDQRPQSNYPKQKKSQINLFHGKSPCWPGSVGLAL